MSGREKWTAKVRTILGDDPNTVEEDHDAEIRTDVTSAICVVVAGMGHVLYAPETGKAMFTSGPGTEREIDQRQEDGVVELTIIKNSRGQRRMVVVLQWHGDPDEETP